MYVNGGVANDLALHPWRFCGRFYFFDGKDGQDERYLTETNIAAIEKGIERILAEYRRELCK